MKKITVKLKNNSYPIFIGNKIINKLNELFSTLIKTDKIFLVYDLNTAKLFSKIIKNNLSRNKNWKIHEIVIPSGERTKSLIFTEKIFSELIKSKVTRKSTIVAIGGGVVGDLTGFVASTILRGINFVQIPTTLLAQVDSSVGGKVGVNHSLGKNLIGSFYQPKFVAIDTDFLKTVPKREIVCGLGEIIKYGIIRDKGIFSSIEMNLEKIILKKTDLSNLIIKSLKIKSKVVSLDERENNLRAILNCGHTIGHALEKFGKYNYWKHGEAILLGLVAESFISMKLNKLSKTEFDRIFSLIKKINIPKISEKVVDNQSVYEVMKSDKKNIKNEIYFSLPLKIGNAALPISVNKNLIFESLNFLKNNF